MPSNKTIVDFLESQIKYRVAFQGCNNDIALYATIKWYVVHYECTKHHVKYQNIVKSIFSKVM